MLTPKWEKLAGELKNLVKVAYWDTETNAQPPALLGQIKGTPTIKAFVPDRKSSRNAKKAVDYNQAREVKDMLRFATSHMPSFVEKIDGWKALVEFRKKADEWGLPQVLLFSKTPGTSSTIKALSAEYRRRLLIAEVKGGKSNERAVKEYKVEAYPTLLALRGSEEPLKFTKEPTYGRLDNFLAKVALKKPVLKKPEASKPKEEL